MNSTMVNETAAGVPLSKGLKRQRSGEASNLGPGAECFADLILMTILSPNVFGVQEEAQAAPEQVPGALAIQDAAAAGIDSGPILQLLQQGTSAEIPSAQQTEELIHSAGDILLETQVKQATPTGRTVRMTPAETGKPGVQAVRGAYAEAPFPEADIPQEKISISVMPESGKPAFEADPWENLYRAAGEVKLKLSQLKPDTAAPEELEVPLAESQRPVAFSLAEAEKVLIKDTPIEQISHGVAEGLKEGKSEFVIKLKPERLGEITVRLLEEDGKMSLRIEASSPDTARLINNDLSALKDAVSSMKVEVREAVTQAPDTSWLESQQFSMGSQQFSNNRTLYQGKAFAPSHERIIPELVGTQTASLLPGVGLDRYI